MSEKRVTSEKKKALILVVFAVMFIFGVVGYIIMQKPELFTAKKAVEPTSMYSDRIKSYNFYEADYEEDIFADENYLAQNRYITYTEGPESFTVTDGDFVKYGNAVAFLAEYFEAVIAGDAETVNGMFNDVYYENNEPYDRFTPQKIYDAEIEFLQSEEDGGDMLYVYQISYKIMRNNGTFRNDMESDASRPLYFTLRESTDGVKIEAVSAG